MGWLKIILPLIALALLSTLFLLSRPKDVGRDILFADPSLGDRAERQQVTAPVFSAVSNQGDLITLRARSARPQQDGVIVAEDVDVLFGLTDQSQIILNADTATLDQPNDAIVLKGGVRIVSTTGYELMTAGLRANIGDLYAESLDSITGLGPAGRFTAGKLMIIGGETEGQTRLVFTDGVKLVYDPQK